MFAGASNIQGGLTIDLANLNQIQISQDRTLTHVGAGNHWIDVYSKLVEQQLAVIGGRVAGIGVGGLTLGGTLHVTNNLKKQNTYIYQVGYPSSPAVTAGHVTMSEATRYTVPFTIPIRTYQT